jgi:hypothetical protein
MKSDTRVKTITMPIHFQWQERNCGEGIAIDSPDQRLLESLSSHDDDRAEDFHIMSSLRWADVFVALSRREDTHVIITQ